MFYADRRRGRARRRAKLSSCAAVSGSARDRPGSGRSRQDAGVQCLFGGPRGDHDRGMSQGSERGLVEQLNAHASVEAFRTVSLGLPGAM